MPRKKNITIQLHTKLNEKIRLGTSRHEAKKQYADKCLKEGIKPKLNESPYIHSAGTAENYRQVINQFSAWIKEERPDVWSTKDLSNITKDVVYQYLQQRQEKGLSAWTVSRDLAALNKCLDLNLTKQEGGLKERSIFDIQRSRHETSNDKHYNAENYKDPIYLSQSFGLRRESIIGGNYTLKEGISLFMKNDKVYASVIEKGGKYREAPCLSHNKEEILSKYVISERDSLTKEQFIKLYNTTPGENLVKEYSTMIDNHRFRGEYARNLYKELSEKKGDDIKSDLRGYDREVILQVSKALGHGRVDVVLNHYMR